MAAEEAPYPVRLNQADALELVKASAILLILDLPPGNTFGLNMQMFVVGPNFRGVKILLPGPHFVYYSSRSRHGGDSSPVTGFFIHASPSQVILRQWDTQEERLVKLKDSSEEERYELAARRMEFDRQLAPYNLDLHKTWQLLSNSISLKVIGRIEPVGGDISVMAEAALVQQSATTPAERRMYEQIAKGRESLHQRISSMSVDGNNERETQDSVEETNDADMVGGKSTSGRCYYTHVPHFVKQTGMTASELTALNLDKTQLLEYLLEKEYEGEEELLLGELQFSFIAFLMGQSLESFGQWKRIVSLLLTCEEAFLRIIYSQLKRSLQPESKADTSADNIPVLDDAWLTEDNFLKLLLKDFFDMLRDASPIDGELLRQAKRLKKLVEETLGWIFEVDNVGDVEDDEIAEAVFESVVPRSAGDVLPTSDAGILLSVTDRLDSLVGLFGVGRQPSASADPFGMRRSAYGLVQALVENHKNLDLRNALRIAADFQPIDVPESILQEVDGGANVELARSVLAEQSSTPTLAARSVTKPLCTYGNYKEKCEYFGENGRPCFYQGTALI